MAPTIGKSRKRRPIPLTNKSAVMKSRKRARQVTTLFHKLTKERDEALKSKNSQKVQDCNKLLEDMGGREEYQRASQLSTSFHSTSKWVLGCLARNGWLYGIPVDEINNDNPDTSKLRKQRRRRTTRLLEVGAINTELLDAAEETKVVNGTSEKKYRLDVRAIDLHSMDKRIEQHDFLDLPFTSSDPTQRYDVTVCSMVINCVSTPEARGKMLARLYHHLRPGGLLFLTLPKFCLTKSAFLTPQIFRNLLERGGVGFSIEATKESPRVSFFVCRRPEMMDQDDVAFNPVWKKQAVRNKGRKFPNQFSVVLDEDEVVGKVSEV